MPSTQETKIQVFRTSPEIPPLPFPSFQASFRRIDEHPDYLGKVYSRERVWGLIPLDSPQERTKIIKDEVILLRLLAPQLNAQYGLLDMPSGDREEAVVMRILQPTDFLEHKIAAKENISLDIFEDLANRVAEFHFNQEYMLSAPSTPLRPFLSELMRQEVDILKRIAPEETEKFKRWDSLMQAFIEKNTATLDRRQTLLGEPIVGHGDIKISNVIVTADGVGITDPAPVELWKINDRRMDAYFLAADLELSGHQEAARRFWVTYTREHNNALPKLGLTPSEQDEVRQSNEVVDIISLIYRFGIFYRLARASGDTVRASLSEKYIVSGYQKMSDLLI